MSMHAHLVAEVQRRFRVAVIAGNSAGRTEWTVEPWTPPSPDALPASSWVVAGTDGEDGIAVVNGSYRADHIALHDPADAIRRYEADLRRLERHAIVWRDIGWRTEDDDTQYDEIPVCGHCVPKHAHFRSRAEVPEGPCVEVRDLAASLGVEVTGAVPD